MCFMHCAITCSKCSSFIELMSAPRLKGYVKLAAQSVVVTMIWVSQKIRKRLMCTFPVAAATAKKGPGKQGKQSHEVHCQQCR